MNAQPQLRVYEQLIANLDDVDSPDELELDVSLVLAERDSLTRLVLTAEEQERLGQLDKQLRAHASMIAMFLPGPNPPGRAHWWWYLHESQSEQQMALETA